MTPSIRARRRGSAHLSDTGRYCDRPSIVKAVMGRLVWTTFTGACRDGVVRRSPDQDREGACRGGGVRASLFARVSIESHHRQGSDRQLRRLRRGGPCRLHAGSWRDAGAGGRKRFRQVVDRAVAAAVAAAGCGLRRKRGGGWSERDRGGGPAAAPAARRHCRYGVSGADDQPQSAHPDRPTDRRGGAAASAGAPRRRRGRGLSSCSTRSAFPMRRTGSTRSRISCPAGSGSG